tara:strand:+ start:8882 stop:9529 length:648 start_codon:yes stop_codon:yes gene_type:complete
MVTAKDIVKSYGDVDVLMGVNLNISKGEIVSIVGKSGSGKSTLLQILGTIENPDAGKVVIDNTDILSMSRKELASFRNKNIGFVFQFHHLLPEFTALENICIPALISGDNKSTAESKAKELLGYLELSHRSNHKPDAMSGGEQQRVAIARSLINRPSIILADEPSGNLDSSASSELHKLILNLRKQLNQTFIIVTHNKDLADMADRKLEIADGLI